ncbi:MAG: PorT family protein [Muribaculaceae bacterium]|nr:PorT family protein [Muribaculaceae bacterium]MDE6794426.1 PorT family protein [Muribaculaceae bacterium]
MKSIRKIAMSAFLVMASLLPNSLGAQTHYSSNVAIGVKGGMDFSEVFFNPNVRQKLALGITGGVMFRYIEEDHFGLIAELNFAQRGWSENFEDAPYHYTRTTNYVELPLLAHIFFGRRGRFFFNAGPQVGLFLGDNVNANFDPKEMATLPDFPYKNRMNEQMLLKVTQKLDYGISAGLGGEFNLNKRNSLSLEARFYFGLGNIFSAKRTDTYSASNQWSIMATVGYWLRIK